ncbi:MAG TPA: hypothetical protein DCP98_01965 [Sphaerochaeta sp.]|nr:hypothetical protein [Sphaerochaeta sp.]
MNPEEPGSPRASSHPTWTAPFQRPGIGSYAIQIGELKIGAIVALNALGDIYGWRTNEQIAGLLTEDRKSLRSTMEYMSSSIEAKENKFTGNTTLAVIVTNAYFDKAQLCKIAGMAHDGYARSINPVHTSGPRYIFSQNTMNRPLLPI